MMRAALALTCLVVAGASPAAEQPAAANDPMAAWAPRKVTREAADRKEITALLHAMDEAGKKGDLQAAVALVDFPVLMVTDDSKGEASGEAWTKERWTEVMAPFYKPMPDMKVSHKPTIFLVTDSLATVDDVQTMKMGPKQVATRSSMLVVRRGGKWLVKSMVEGGWGDAMAAPPPAEAPHGADGTGAPPPAAGAPATQK